MELQEGAGCSECGGTGYRGRTAIHELLDFTDKIRERSWTGGRFPKSNGRRGEEGMTFMRESAVEKVRKGVSTLIEIKQGHMHRGSVGYWKGGSDTASIQVDDLAAPTTGKDHMPAKGVAALVVYQAYVERQIE